MKVAALAATFIQDRQLEKFMTTSELSRRRRGRLVWRNTVAGWSFILPNFIGFAVLTMVPVGVLFYIAFTKWNVFRRTATWIGPKNFIQLWNDDLFWTSMWNTLYYTVFHIPLTMAAALGLALLLNRKLRGVAFFRTAAFFPYITSIVALTYVWNLLFSPEYGPINQFLRFIGIDNPPGWTVSADWSMPAVILVGTWREMGYYMLIFLAGLQAVPVELYDAAVVDGATSFQVWRLITIPSLRPTFVFLILTGTIDGMSRFSDLWALGGPSGTPARSLQTIVMYMYQTAFEGSDFNLSSAVAVVLFAIVLVLTLINFRLFLRRDFAGAE